MKIKITFFLFVLNLVAFALNAQQNATGLIMDDSDYEDVLMKAPLVRGLYTTLPTNASLKRYCPIPGNQNPYGTCVGWATSYAARTILWAKEHGYNNKQRITNHAFSPAYIYRSIVAPSDYPNCDRGAIISQALQTMKTRGTILKSDYNPSCPSTIPFALKNKAGKYKIDDFARLFGIYDDNTTKINTTKKALSEDNPVVIGMIVPKANGKPSSFNYVNSSLWTPTNSERANRRGGGHAMCVVGYDDNKFGGAFEVINSWGTNWGNNGFFWIKYSDYALLTKYAFELIEKVQPKPIVINPPKPKPTKDYDFAGDLRIVFDNGTQMSTSIKEIRGLFVSDEIPVPKNKPANFSPDPTLTIGKFIAYRAARAYSEGTRFRVYLRNNQPAYVYVITMDGTNRASQLFPHKPNISPVLNYSNSEIALPSEKNYIQLDHIRGTDILCLLYSKEPLNIPRLNKRLEQETGTFFQRLYKVLKNKLVNRQYLRYYNERMRFEVKSYNTGTVVPIVLEIPHN